jgi:uncharacterized phage-associated protein
MMSRSQMTNNTKSSSTVANCFIELAMNDGNSLTPMQLLKLTFLAHGWMLGLHGRGLIADRIEAWKYGPVIPVLYRSVKKYGADPVTDELPAPRHERLDRIQIDIIKQVYRIYGHLSGPKLSNLTHEVGSPWSSVYDVGTQASPITDDLIRQFYALQAAKHKEKRAAFSAAKNNTESENNERRGGPPRAGFAKETNYTSQTATSERRSGHDRRTSGAA